MLGIDSDFDKFVAIVLLTIAAYALHYVFNINRFYPSKEWGNMVCIGFSIVYSVLFYSLINPENLFEQSILAEKFQIAELVHLEALVLWMVCYTVVVFLFGVMACAEGWKEKG